MKNDPALQLIAVVVVIIIVLAIAGAIAYLIMDCLEARENKKKSKELTAAPEENRFDINLEALRPEVYKPNMMGSNIRRV